jgi:threonine/homoserine/homoserine lactone efflux protein
MSLLFVSLAALVCSFVGSLPLAGPIALLVVSNGVSGRHKEALRIALGAAMAEGIYAFLAFWGFATFLARYKLVLPISHGVTAVIFLALGGRFLFFKAKTEEQKPPGDEKAGRFWLGFSISALNPTLLATWGAVTTFLYSKQLVRFTGLLAVPFGACAAAGIALWGLMTVALLKRYRHAVPNGVITWVVRGMGVVLICGAVWSGVELARYVASAVAERAAAIEAHRGRTGECICIATANTWRILPAHERVPVGVGGGRRDPRGVRGGGLAGRRERG